MVEMSTPGGKPETPPPWGPPPPWREEKKGPLGRLLAWRPKKVSSDQLAAMGVATLLAYGAVSNVNMAACVILSWVTYGKTTGMSPLDAGQWPGFIAIYAGIWVANNFLRPLRVAAAIALGPFFERIVKFCERKLKVSQQAAFGLTVFVINIVGTLTILGGGLTLATAVTGTPLLKTVQDPPSLVVKR